MTGRGRNAVRIETEIEKFREESNWKKVIDLAEQLRIRSPNQECLSTFLIGEGKLESYLEEFPPVESNYDSAKMGLSEAKKYLLMVTGDNGKQAGVALDSHLLLGKLNYASGFFEDALNEYTLAELHTLKEKNLSLKIPIQSGNSFATMRSLRIVAESYAIKGLCLEKTFLQKTTKFKLLEKESEMIRCFELGADLALLYLQRAGAVGVAAAVRPGLALETALQRAPILHIRSGNLQKAIERYREMLSAIESISTQSLRLTLARQLAEVLLRGVSGTVYCAPDRASQTSSAQGTLTRRKETPVSEGPWKPKKYSGLNQFIPRNECEEIILLLLIGEAMAVRDAVLSQSPEFKQARIHAHENATAVYDLLTIATVRWGQLSLLNETLERAMKFSFGEGHVWRQRTLCCISSALRCHSNSSNDQISAAIGAKSVLKQTCNLRPKDSAVRLLGAKTCYQMGLIDDGLKLSEEALALQIENPTNLLARCNLFIGIGNLMKAQMTSLRYEKQIATSRSLDHLLKAVKLDSNDHLATYYLALQYALLGKLNESMTWLCRCLVKRVDASAVALQLLILLLSAGAGADINPADLSDRRYLLDSIENSRWSANAAIFRATEAAKIARTERPLSHTLAHTHAYLQLECEGGEAALSTGKELLMILKNSSELEAAMDNTYQELDKYSDSKSVLQIYNDLDSNKDSNSLRAASVAASRVERALSEATSTVSSPRDKRGEIESASNPASASSRLRAWLLLADLSLKLDRMTTAEGCISEATSIIPIHHLIMHMKGMVFVHKQEWEEAKQCFQNSIAINPGHVASLVELGVCHHRLGWNRLAEKVLWDAARLEPLRPDTWKKLGLVLDSLGEHEAAADCMATALELQLSAPILPFSSIPYVFE